MLSQGATYGRFPASWNARYDNEAVRHCHRGAPLLDVLYIAQVPEDDLRILQTGYQVRPLPYEAIELDR